MFYWCLISFIPIFRGNRVDRILHPALTGASSYLLSIMIVLQEMHPVIASVLGTLPESCARSESSASHNLQRAKRTYWNDSPRSTSCGSARMTRRSKLGLSNSVCPLASAATATMSKPT